MARGVLSQKAWLGASWAELATGLGCGGGSAEQLPEGSVVQQVTTEDWQTPGLPSKHPKSSTSPL